MMSVPRELMISDGKLIQTPVRELCGYRQNKLVVNDTLRGEKTYEGVNGRVIDMTVDIKKADCGHFTMQRMRFMKPMSAIPREHKCLR